MASSASMNGSATPHTADHGDGGEHSSSTAPAAAATAGTRKGSGSATGEGGQQQVDMGAAADAVAALLKALGEDTGREGLRKTPTRVARALAFCTSGYRESVADVVGEGLFHEDVSELVVVKDIDLFSMCEHHMLPFHGKAHVGYVPNGTIIGLSKIAKLVDLFARRLQVQERLTRQIAEAMQEVLNAKAVCVMVEATHMCMVMRGVQKVGSSTVSTCYLGDAKTDQDLRTQFLTHTKS